MRLQHANISLQNGGAYADNYGDIYYNATDGFAESLYTYINGNHLLHRFASLTAHQQMVIGEVGFGTGLNFILTAETFLTRNQHAHLYYVSAEKHPIALPTLKRLHHNWPQAALREKLYQQYPDNHAGFHLLRPHPRVHLLLLLGDACQLYQQFDGKVDAWYLDGFAPKCNPECWQADLIAAISRSSKPGTTLSSFSAAGEVRRLLSQYGFFVERIKGYGNKKHMIRATCQTPVSIAPSWSDRYQGNKASKVAVIGAGIAGAATARVLAEKGIQTTVYQSDAHRAASDNPYAIAHLQPSLHPTPAREYYLQAWHHARRTFQELSLDILKQNAQQSTQPHTGALAALPFFIPLPIKRLADTPALAKRHQQLYQQGLLSDAHWQYQEGELSDVSMGALRLPLLCQYLLAHPNIEVIHKTCHQLPTDMPSVICTGANRALIPEAYAQHATLPLRGQSSVFRQLGSLKQEVICSDKTLIPDSALGLVYVGSSYYPNNQDLTPYEADNLINRAFFERHYAQVSLGAAVVSEFVGIRATSRDYLPLVGAIARSDALAESYAIWRKNARVSCHAAPIYHENVLMHQGLGSKGTTTAFLNAELIAAQLLNLPLPISRSLTAHLQPARYFIRQLRRQTV